MKFKGYIEYEGIGNAGLLNYWSKQRGHPFVNQPGSTTTTQPLSTGNIASINRRITVGVRREQERERERESERERERGVLCSRQCHQMLYTVYT